MNIRGKIATFAIFIIMFIMLVTLSALDFVFAEALITPTSIPLNFSLLPVAVNSFGGATSMPTAVASTIPPITLPPTTTNTGTPTVTNTPTPTTTELPTATNTPMPTNTATSLPPSATGDIRITKIFYNGYVPLKESDEYVEIKNYDTRVILLGGWQVIDGDGDPSVSLPVYAMQPGEICRVYTNQDHPDWCGFSFAEGSAIWNNNGDTAFLKDSYGELIDECSYAGGGDDGAIAICE